MTTKIEEIINEYENARLMITRPSDCRHYSPGTIFDEDKSVKWNKEEVIRRNEYYDNEVQKLRDLRGKATKKWYDELMSAIAYECNTTVTIASSVYTTLRCYHEADDIRETVDTVIDIFETLKGTDNE